MTFRWLKIALTVFKSLPFNKDLKGEFWVIEQLFNDGRNPKKAILKLPAVLTVLFLVLVGIGQSALTNSYSETAGGTVRVEKGFFLGLNSSSTEGYTSGKINGNISSGGSVNLDFKMKNRANDRSQPAVEVFAVDMPETDLTWRELESFKTDRKNDTAHSRNYAFSVDPKGNPELEEEHYVDGKEVFNQTVSSTESKSFGIVNTDTDSDSYDEMLVCVSDSNGYSHSSNETWKGGITIDTKTSFPSGDIGIRYSLMGLYDPETGSHPPIVRECPQVS